MKLTPWFNSSVKPVRDGIYQTEDDDGELWFNLFESGDWHYGESLPSDHNLGHAKEILPSRCLKRWRGLAQKGGRA